MNQFERSNAMARQACGMPPAKPDHYTSPTICRRCDAVIDAKAHTLDDCESTQQEKAIAADLALDYNKAHRRNNDDFARAMKLQMQQMDAGVLS